LKLFGDGSGREAERLLETLGHYATGKLIDNERDGLGVTVCLSMERDEGAMP
jgi:hypothetical protein